MGGAGVEVGGSGGRWRGGIAWVVAGAISEAGLGRGGRLRESGSSLLDSSEEGQWGKAIGSSEKGIRPCMSSKYT